MQRVLVTGGTGFLGSSLVKRILDNQEVEYVVVPTTNIKSKTSIDLMGIKSDRLNLIGGDVRDYDFVQRMFNEYEFDTIFHLGAMSEVRKCQSNAKLAYDTNIGGTINLLETARMSEGINAIVVSSSDKAYGRCELPYSEEDPLDGKGIYEVSKSCQDLVARSYFYNYDMPVAVTRCSNLYGGADVNFSRIIPNTIRSVLNNKSPLIYTGAEHFIREFLYVDDAVDAYLSIADSIDTTKGNAYNIGSGEKITIGKLVEKILDKMPTDVKIEYRDRTFPEINNQYLDSSKIKKDTGWEAKVGLDEGLSKTIATYSQALGKKKMVELTSREHMLAMVADNPDWSVLDLGCGADGIQLANTYADYEDRTQSYPNNRFVKTDACNTPFKDKEFDFVFAIHLLEHIDNSSDICSELMRIGKRGFIEVPTPFFDNFVLGNSNPPPHGHVKWVTFDNVKKEIVFKPRYQIVAESAVPADTTFLLPFFRDSMHVEIYWENTIDFRIDEPIFSWTSGNSDAPHVVDLRGKKIPSNAKPWQPRRLWK